jgi:hypothetical protein
VVATKVDGWVGREKEGEQRHLIAAQIRPDQIPPHRCRSRPEKEQAKLPRRHRQSHFRLIAVADAHCVAFHLNRRYLFGLR